MANTPHERYSIPNVNGFTETMQIADAGAGNQWIFTIPQIMNEWRYKIIALSFTITTDANAANRNVGLRYFRHSGTYNILRWYNPVVQTAGQTYYYQWSLNLPAEFWMNGAASLQPNGHRYAPLPDVDMTNWERLGLSTTFWQVGDVCVDTVIWIRRWMDQQN